jgi:hypothetical protein
MEAKSTLLGWLGVTGAGASLAWLGVFFALRALKAPAVDAQSTALAQLAANSEHASVELRALEARLTELRGQLALHSKVATDGAPTETGASSEELQKALTKLDLLAARLDAFDAEITAKSHRRDAAASADPDAEARALMESSMAREAVATYQAQFADTGADPDVRLSALRMLRRFPSEMNARGAPVVDTALAMFDEGHDARVRARLISELEGVPDERLVARLVDSLGAGETEELRAEAADALETFVHLPSVRSALEFAASSDPSNRVKRGAERSVDHYKQD